MSQTIKVMVGRQQADLIRVGDVYRVVGVAPGGITATVTLIEQDKGEADLATVQEIEVALLEFRPHLPGMIRQMAAERRVTEATPAAMRALILEEASWDDIDGESDHTYGARLREIAGRIVVPPPSKPWRPEVIADGSGKFATNALRFETAQEALEWARDLSRRWLLVRAYRAFNEETEEVFGEVRL